MAVPAIRGNLLPLLQWSEQDYDPTRGYVFRYSFKGASQYLMGLQQNDYARNGIASRLRFEHDTAVLEVEDSTQQTTLDVWEIVGNEESRDVFTHPTMEALATDDDMADLRERLANNDTPSNVSADYGATVARFYGLALRGSSEYRRGQYVLRHITNAPNRWAVNIADVGVDQIYTTAQLLTEVQDSSLWVNPLPGRLAFKISHIPTPTPIAFYQWGWLKGASTETTAANNRIAIVTEYVLEMWSTDDYAPF